MFNFARFLKLSWNPYSLMLRTNIYIYTYINMCVRICMCVCSGVYVKQTLWGSVWVFFRSCGNLPNFHVLQGTYSCPLKKITFLQVIFIYFFRFLLWNCSIVFKVLDGSFFFRRYWQLFKIFVSKQCPHYRTKNYCV